MFGNIGLPELAVIILFGLVIFGPDRLPKAASDAAQLIKRIRAMSHGALSDLRTELGPEFSDIDVRSLHPRRIVEDAWNNWDSEPETNADDEPAAPKPPTAARHRTAAPRRRRTLTPDK